MMLSDKRRALPELLAPAGSREALDAAISAGADAVYFGGKSFNARMSADNFDDDAMEDAIRCCSFWGVRSNITLNTLPTEREEAEILRYAEKLAAWGADAVICADLGIARLIHTYFPELALHASTQCMGHNADAAAFFSDIGFCRMVAARELSFEDLSLLCKRSPIEVELFIHGALCVSQSGGCLFSSLVGNRSGNRGACAQPCRLPYVREWGRGRDEEYPLSLKDNCLAAHVPALLSLSAASFKIEGRMKTPAYVGGVVRIWRRLLDEGRAADAGEIAQLASLFSRGGTFTDGYFRRKTDNSMCGVRTEKDKAATVAAEKQTASQRLPARKLPVSLFCTVKKGEAASLCAVCGPDRVTVYGAAAEKALTRPISADDIVKNITKLGATPFAAGEVVVDADADVMMPLSALNALRRDAARALEMCRRQRTSSGRSVAAPDYRAVMADRGVRRTEKAAYPRQASFLFCDRIPVGARNAYDVIYLPLEQLLRDPAEAVVCGVNGVMLPPVIFDSERNDVCRMLREARAHGIVHVLVCNPGHIALAREAGEDLILHGDLRLNVKTAHTANVYAEAGLVDLVLSPEMTLPQMRDLCAACPTGAVTYGRLPMMTLQRCIIRDRAPQKNSENQCSFCERDRVFVMRDRKRTPFYITRTYPHRNIIWNSAVVYMADKQDAYRRIGLNFTRHCFTTESRDEVSALICAYEGADASGLPYADFPAIRRM
ncbi:MAG: U32 family peptidase [Clostridia bacterium]|nr:U32 family peptidase [Clostridia bacterium]